MKGKQLKELKALNKRDMYRLVAHLLEITPEAKRIASKWLTINAKKAVPPKAENDEPHLNDELLMEYWDDVQPLISVSNKTGAGRGKIEETLRLRIEKISELIKTKHISREAKFVFMDEVFSQYRGEESRFGDILMETVFEICENKEDWKYFINRLKEKAGVKENNLIIYIYRYFLRDNNKYLNMRRKHLAAGKDYWDLVTFFRKEKKLKEAVETAEKGISKGTGSLKELYEFLFDRYLLQKDMTNLRRITRAMIKQGDKEPELLERLFKYYKRINNNAKAKDILLRWYESLRDGGHSDQYIKIKKYLKQMGRYLKKADWKRIGPEFLDYVKQDSISAYLDICREKDMKKEILEIIREVPQMKLSGTRLRKQSDELAEKLQHDFPEEIIRYYWKMIYKVYFVGNRISYAKVIVYLKKARKIYISILKDKKSWEKRLKDIKKDFQNCRAIMKGVKSL